MNIRNAINKYAGIIKRILAEDISEPIALPSMPDAAAALTVAALTRARPTPLHLWILADTEALEKAHANLTALSLVSEDVAYFPPEDSPHDADNFGHRMRLLRQLAAETPPRVIVTSIQALLQQLPPPATLQESSLTIALDDDIDLKATTEFLNRVEYCFVGEVHNPGEASRKGGILDIWPPGELWPVRIELFGPTVDSMRQFDPQTQLSIKKIAEISVPPAIAGSMTDYANTSNLCEHFKSDFTAIWSEPGNIEQAANQYLELYAQTGHEFKITASDFFRAAKRNLLIAPDCATPPPAGLPKFTAVPHSVAESSTPLAGLSDEQRRMDLTLHINRRLSKRWHVALFCHTNGALEHITEHIFAPIIPPDKLKTTLAPLSVGFECEELRLTVLTETDIYGRRKTIDRRYDPHAATRGARKHAGAPISDFTDIAPGDLVVHVEHGIGRYIGIETINVNHTPQEVLAIEYADNAKLYVPMSHAHLLGRYVGLGSRKVNLHKLGGKRWRRDKEQASQAVMDLAADLLEVQAARNFLQGQAFPQDDAIQHEFAAAFPFQETEDQTKVIEEIRRDMQSTRPMDRLVCGDAGYGKTEVAMRAAFRAAANGYQTAVLVPTTILAQQHYHTFTERMAGFNITIEVLSRFCSAKERRAIIENIKGGKTDIIIGTHSLISPDISFANLGLVIIDEEQRFGVRHKEHLKQMKKLVDVLTLSATPIPRTLYMSMTGARDMSLLQTPPSQRTPIETIVTPATDEVIRQAVLRELRRNGQIYYLHNRVMTIHRLRKRLEKLLPEARIEVAHGQMKSSELAATMQRFSDGDFDLLLCTTIIESGMDIPRANTILIDRADRFGIADLYQLRGRVGRSSHKAYAYLLLPPHGYIDRDARERIHAVRKHSDLGAGFNLAVRDMEIRGAGNILGSAQSGHIAAVGFCIYCQMLQRSIAKLKGEKPPPLIDTEVQLDFIIPAPEAAPPEGAAAAYIPFTYIDNERLRTAVYRRLAEAVKPADIDKIEAELIDRFGRMPDSVHRLLATTRIRVIAAEKQIQSVAVRQQKIMVKRQEQYTQYNHRFPSLTATDPDAKLAELLEFIRTL